MDRFQFSQKFARRLSQVMERAGHYSMRKNSSLDVTLLAKVAGCSYQMARRYLLGEALPEIYVVLKIAKWLMVSPGWLLFGDNDHLISNDKTLSHVEIDLGLLKYILIKSDDLFSYTENKENVVNFIVDAVYDASHLNADAETTKKIIDMMVSSASKLNLHKNKKGKMINASTKAN